MQQLHLPTPQGKDALATAKKGLFFCAVVVGAIYAHSLVQQVMDAQAHGKPQYYSLVLKG